MNGHEQHKINPESHDPHSDSFTKEDIHHARERIAQKTMFRAVNDSIDAYVMVLNTQRQILAINQQMRKDFQIDADVDFLGLHPGETIGCLHAEEGASGCGSSPLCDSCGVAAVITESQQKHDYVEKECTLLVRRGNLTELMEYVVRATPINAESMDLIVVVFQNTSAPRRQEALDRAFYHDVLNTLGGLLGWSKMLQEYESLDSKLIASRIWNLSNRLCNEIQDQRRLSQADRGDLVVCLEKVPISQILHDLQTSFPGYDEGEGRILDIEDVDPEEELITDPSLLLRVLVNMMKNALEASNQGDIIRVWHDWQEGAPIFFVQNPGVIPEPIARQIFQRSFTTKGSHGRGIGTFSMKLFGEKYLKGKVDFKTSPETGTIFHIHLPAYASIDDWESENYQESGQF